MGRVSDKAKTTRDVRVEITKVTAEAMITLLDIKRRGNTFKLKEIVVIFGFNKNDLGCGFSIVFLLLNHQHRYLDIARSIAQQ